jgi:tetratricopeptide (TPR) repeat protein
MKPTRAALALAVMICFCLNTMVYASGTSSQQMQSSNGGNPNAGNPNANSDNGSSVSDQVTSLYNQGLDAVKNNDYVKAVDLFQQASDTDPHNADVLNQLAHAQRKTGKLDDAIENYWKALKIRPDFAEAREYMGEAYLQGAVEQAKLLKSYGDKGQEQLEDLTKDFQEAVEQIKK